MMTIDTQGNRQISATSDAWAAGWHTNTSSQTLPLQNTTLESVAASIRWIFYDKAATHVTSSGSNPLLDTHVLPSGFFPFNVVSERFHGIQTPLPLRYTADIYIYIYIYMYAVSHSQEGVCVCTVGKRRLR